MENEQFLQQYKEQRIKLMANMSPEGLARLQDAEKKRAATNKSLGKKLLKEITKTIPLNQHDTNKNKWYGECPSCKSSKFILDLDSQAHFNHPYIASFFCQNYDLCLFSGMTKEDFLKCLSLDPEKERQALEYAEINTVK